MYKPPKSFKPLVWFVAPNNIKTPTLTFNTLHHEKVQITKETD